MSFPKRSRRNSIPINTLYREVDCCYVLINKKLLERFSLLFCLLAQCLCGTQVLWKNCSNCVLQILLLHAHTASYVLFVFCNPPLLKSGINRYFYSKFMYHSSQKKKKKTQKTQKCKRNKIKRQGFVVEGVEEEEELQIQFQAPGTQGTSQPSLSSHFLLHLPSKFLSFPPLLICTSPATINPARLSNSNPALPPTQLANLHNPFH